MYILFVGDEGNTVYFEIHISIELLFTNIDN